MAGKDEKPKTGKPEDNGWPIIVPHHREWPHVLKTSVSVIAIILTIVLFLAVLIGLIYLIEDIIKKFSEGSAFAEVRNSILMLTALLGASGIPLFVWRTSIAARQAETARDRAYTELFTKAIEQLGADKLAYETVPDEQDNPKLDDAGKPIMVEKMVPNIEVRIGAIYALGRIMKDSEKDAEAIVDTLAAYIRENCGEPEPFEFELPEQEDGEPIGKWLERLGDAIGIPFLDLPGTLCSNARRLTDTPEANRSDVVTALKVLADRPARLKNEETMPDLRNVNFQCVDLGHFDLSFLNLSGVQMQGAYLTGTLLQGTFLISAQMQGTEASFAQMQGAKLLGAEIQGVNLSHAQMQGTDLSWAKMQGADLSNAEMQGADLSATNMHGANLSATDIQGANLSATDMQGANLSGAEIAGTHITSAQITAASVMWVDFSKADPELEELKKQVPEMFGHKTLTILPEGIDPPDHWSEADMDTTDGLQQYREEWQAFKKKMGVE